MQRRARKSDHGTMLSIVSRTDPRPCVFFCAKIGEGERKAMPQNLFERMMFALITVVITVHAFVFYNLYVVSGSALMSAAVQEIVCSRSFLIISMVRLPR